MTIYIINLITVSLYSLISKLLYFKTKNKKYSKFLYAILLTQMILLLSMRSTSVGTDIQGYIYNFKFIIPNLNFLEMLNHRYEIGYILYNRLIYFFSSNENFLLSITAILCVIPVGFTIYKYSKMPFLSIGLYIAFNYYYFLFSGLRQAIAYSIIFFSFNYLNQRQFRKFFVIVVLASLFHKSALIFLPAYFIYELKLSSTVLTFVVIIDLIIFMFRKSILSIFIKLFYDQYTVIESASYNWLILSIFIFLFGMLSYKKMSRSIQNRSLFNYVLVGISIMLFTSVGNNIMRIVDYYFIFVVLFIPEILNNIEDKRMLVIIGYVQILIIFIIHFWFLYANGYGIIPYRFFW